MGRALKLVAHEKKKEGSSDDWETPPEIYDPLRFAFNFRIDVAANEQTRRCLSFLGPGSKIAQDALDSNWGAGPCWCNPPFSLWMKFMKHAVEQSRFGATVAFLVPPRCETPAFHEFGSCADEIIFLKRRVKFILNGKRGTRPGTASAIFVFRPRLLKAEYGNPRIVYWTPEIPLREPK